MKWATLFFAKHPHEENDCDCLLIQEMHTDRRPTCVSRSLLKAGWLDRGRGMRERLGEGKTQSIWWQGAGRVEALAVPCSFNSQTHHTVRKAESQIKATQSTHTPATENVKPKNKW